MVLVLGIVKASLEILGIGIGVKKVVLLMSDTHPYTSRDKISTVEIAIKSVPCTLEYSQTAVDS